MDKKEKRDQNQKRSLILFPQLHDREKKGNQEIAS
jgi:hypothetical protein